tara:strand:- start:301 stop:519 length:219 start_codon:yes stop_codon:yes gene_type:complete
MEEVSGATLIALRTLFPGLPERITYLMLTLTPGNAPGIQCRYLTEGLGCISLVEETLSVEIDESEAASIGNE